jgi:hypothetical protein
MSHAMTTTDDRVTLNWDESSADGEIATFAALGMALNQVATHSWLVRTMDPSIGALGKVATYLATKRIQPQ